MGLASCVTTCITAYSQLTDSCIENCNNDNGWSGPLSTAEKVVYSVATVLLVLLTTVIACMMGSTLGIDMATLQAGMAGNDAGVRRKSKRVVRLRSIGGSLLFSALLVTTVGTHVAVAVLLTKFLGAVVGLLVAFALILIFAEILPPAFCSTHALEIAWSTAWLASLLLVLLFPVAWPVSILLDRLIVHEKAQSALIRWCLPCFKKFPQSPSMETLSPQYLPDTTTYSEDDQDTYTSNPFGDSGKMTSSSIPSNTSSYLPQQIERATIASSEKSRSASSTPPIAQVVDVGPYASEATSTLMATPIAIVIDDANSSPSLRDDPHEMTFKDLVDPSELQKDDLERIQNRQGQASSSGWEARRGKEEASDSSSQSHPPSQSQSRQYSAMSSASTGSTSAGERVSTTREAGAAAGGNRGTRQVAIVGALERRAPSPSVTSRPMAGTLERRATLDSQSPTETSTRLTQSGAVLKRRATIENGEPARSFQVGGMERRRVGGIESGGQLSGEDGGGGRGTRPMGGGPGERRIVVGSPGKMSPQKTGTGEREEGGETTTSEVKLGIGEEWRNLRRQNEIDEGGGEGSEGHKSDETQESMGQDRTYVSRGNEIRPLKTKISKGEGEVEQYMLSPQSGSAGRSTRSSPIAFPEDDGSFPRSKSGVSSKGEMN